MNVGQHLAIANFIWGIADDVLRDVYVRGKYRDVILPMTVGRRAPVKIPAAINAEERGITRLPGQILFW